MYVARTYCVNAWQENYEKLKIRHHLIPHFLFGILKALSNKVNRLVLCDWVFLEAGLIWVEGLELGLVCQAVLEENSVEILYL